MQKYLSFAQYNTFLLKLFILQNYSFAANDTKAALPFFFFADRHDMLIFIVANMKLMMRDRVFVY